MDTLVVVVGFVSSCQRRTARLCDRKTDQVANKRCNAWLSLSVDKGRQTHGIENSAEGHELRGIVERTVRLATHQSGGSQTQRSKSDLRSQTTGDQQIISSITCAYR